MKTLFLTVSMIVLIAFNSISQDVTWPRQLTNNGSVLTMYQPQVENWNNYTQIDYRLAFSLLPSNGKEALGVMYMHASTDVDMDTHLANVYSMSIKDVHFPSLNASEAATMSALVKTFLTPGRSLLMSVEQIAACTPKQTPTNTVSVNNDPPVIFVSYNATILLQLQGPAQTSATGQANLDYVYNSNYPLFLDNSSSTYFLYDGLEWRKSASLNGQWAFTSSLPKSLVTLSKDASWTNLKGIVPAVTKKASVMPDVFFSEDLAEMILFNGQPQYQTIPGTSLQHATNTDEQVFLSNTTNQYYFLSSGRWFSAPGLTGPWAYASASLPADFSNIPTSSPAAIVLASVPGTYEAADAVLIAQIPTMVQVNAASAAKQVNIVYAGDPQFKPIETTSLSYAVNTNDKVIEISDNQFYACVQGIWFTSSMATGPWQTATFVPTSIYTIPPSSPVYNVTYVTQTVTSAGTVQASYTAGYMGAFIVGVGVGAIIASGSGFYYPPYYYHPAYGYPYCYGYPMTYGAYAYHPYPYGGVSYGASYNPYTGTYARSATAYGPYGKTTVGQAYNPYTGTYARGGSVSNGYGTTSAAQAYNPYTGKGASTVQHSSPYGQWGSSTVSNSSGQWAQTQHSTTAQGTTASGRTSAGGGFAAASGANNSGGVAKTAGGNMYAGVNGNVYKNTGDGWQQHSSNGWNDATKPQAQGAGASQGFNSQAMNQEAQNRQRGNAQTQQFGNKSGGWGSGGFGGGGSSRFGGGGGFGGDGGFGGGGFGGGRGGRR